MGGEVMTSWHVLQQYSEADRSKWSLNKMTPYEY